MASEAEIEELKRQWLKDPCWDIEDTDGFGAHRTELAEFHKQQSARWEKERNEQLLQFAVKLGVPGNVGLAQYVMYLEQRLSSLEEKLNN